MPVIVVVDDRQATRAQIAKLTQAVLPKDSGWEVQERAPFPKVDDYATWIAENQEIAVLILDENLQEQGDEAVNYDGHDVVERLRPVEPDFPIFIVTAYSSDELQQQSGPAVESIIDRARFVAEVKLHVSRMLRAGQRFTSAHGKDLSMLGSLSEKVARGEADENDIEALASVREKLALPFSKEEVLFSKDLVPKAEALIQDAKNLIAKISADREKK